jgi:hypothetical protein
MIRALMNYYKLMSFIRKHRALGNDQFTVLTNDSKITILRVKSPSKGSIELKY